MHEQPFYQGPTEGYLDEAFGILRADHRHIESCFIRFEREGSAQLLALTTDLLRSIKMHAELEEQVLYPAYLRITNDTANFRLWTAEHSTERRMAENIAFADPGDESLELLMCVLARRTRAHMREEEGRDGPWALLRASHADLPRLGRCLQHHRDNHLAVDYLRA